ncbi:MAG TPA: anaerobic glycerol-3-phosphate dehydrogenase subunit GlpA [Actinomycetes bacterium]|nr:anaerobic glycerol-3-phosphate dehydrogenase subunit GlpA [Actinomycetes bacterium]
MADLETQVVVVGGGATGTAVLRDLALRGIDAVLVERADLGTGTSGRWHGLLHSGGRYVVKDPVSATECIEENRVLRRIAPHCVEDTGGLFVLLPDNDQAFGDAFVEACARTGVPCEELRPAQARRREPLLTPRLTRAFAVPDGTMDGWKLIGGFVADARARGARVLVRHPVVGMERDGDRILAVRARDAATGEDRLIGCQWVLNAAGAWAGRVAALAGGELRMAPGKGAMVVMVGRWVRGVVNDCRMPGDGDIIVPVHQVAILGTTDKETDDPDDNSVDPAEVDFMLDSAAELVPAIAGGRVLRAFSGSRPLYKAGDDDAGSRDLTRAFFVLDHGGRGGPGNLLSIVGGKLTTCRQMAERTVDALVARMGLTAPCTTATTPLPGADQGVHRLAEPLATVERQAGYGELVCECELVSRRRIEAAVDQGATDLDDLRRQLRLGFGPCQAAFCGWRAAAIVDERRPGATEPLANLERFLAERWRGQRATTWGDGAVQALLNQAIYRGTFDLAPAGGGRGTA